MVWNTCSLHKQVPVLHSGSRSWGQAEQVESKHSARVPGMSPPSCCGSTMAGQSLLRVRTGRVGCAGMCSVTEPGASPLCAFSQGQLLCPQVKDACPGWWAQVTNWACPCWGGGELRELATSKLSDMMPTKGTGGNQSCLFQCILKCTPPPCKENICYAFCSLRHGHLLI